MAAAPPPPPPPRTDMPAAADLPPPPPPLALALPLPETTRRPRRRTREVSSRYLSSTTTPCPVPSSPRLSTSSSRTPSPRAHRPRAATPFANENHPPPPPPPPSTVSRRRAVQKLFDEGSCANPRASVSVSAAAAAGTPRPLPRSTSGPAGAASTGRRGYPRLPTPARAVSCPSSSAAASAVDDAASCCSSDTGSTFTDLSEIDGIAIPAAPCESPPLLGPASCRGGRLSSELRSSVPESGGSARASNPLCYRSLNSALSGCPAPAGKKVNAARPPQPHGVKAAEPKKVAMIGGRKVPGKQEDVHQLRMLENSYLQYRFMNARAAAVARAKASVAEKSLFGLEERIAGLRVSVAEKRMEVERMRREQTLWSVVDAQVPYLDQWSDIQGDHSSSLTGVTSALYNASQRLPVTENVTANSKEITEVLNSAVQLLEPLSPCVKNFLPKVQEVDDLATNLAKVIASERASIEECGNLLYQARNLQMKECSLRGQVMQLKQQVEET